MQKLLLIGLIALLSIGCKTSFRITVKEPSVIDLPNDARSFGIVNAVNEENSPEQKIAGAVLGTEQINGNVEAAERAVEGALRALGKSNSLQGTKTPQIQNIYKADGSINWKMLDSIAEKEGFDGFIELSKMETQSPVGGTVLANATGQNNMRLDGSMYVNTYIIKDHIAIEQFKVFHRYNIPTSGSTSLINILNDSKRKTEYFKALGFQLGYEAAALLYPNWVWANRTFFNKGSRILRRAKPMIQEGNWDIAEEQLTMGLNAKSDRVRGRVLYNLALVNEGQGELDEAIKYAKESALVCGNKLANDYLRILKDRKQQMSILKQQ
jgi:tetratricopeptide (TPR) repeat protein